MHWSFVTTRFPWPLTHGSYLRVYHLSRALRRSGDEVTLISPAGDAEQVREYESMGVRVVASAGRDEGSRLVRRSLSPYVYQPALGHAVASSATDGDGAVVLVGSSALQYAPEACQVGGCVVSDLIDDPLLEERRKLWRQPRPSVLLRRLRFLFGQQRYESAFVPQVDLVTLVSAEDSAGFRGRHPASKVATISNGVDVDYFRPGAEVAADDGRTIVFLGNLGHPPNIDAAWYLVDEIMPRIRQRAPDLRVRLVIIGPNAPQKLCRLDVADVEVLGRVTDLRPHLWQAAMMIVPMRIGTGVKNKLLEGWAAGVPVVASSMSCQGVETVDGENVLLGSTAGVLADQSVRALRSGSLRRRLRAAGLASAGRRSWCVVAGLLRQSVDEVRLRKAGHSSASPATAERS